jgi:hypothetical protein
MKDTSESKLDIVVVAERVRGSKVLDKGIHEQGPLPLQVAGPCRSGFALALDFQRSQL